MIPPWVTDLVCLLPWIFVAGCLLLFWRLNRPVSGGREAGPDAAGRATPLQPVPPATPTRPRTEVPVSPSEARATRTAARAAFVARLDALSRGERAALYAAVEADIGYDFDPREAATMRRLNRQLGESDERATS